MIMFILYPYTTIFSKQLIFLQNILHKKNIVGFIIKSHYVFCLTSKKYFYEKIYYSCKYN